MSLEAANREVYTLPKEGIPVSIPDREQGGQKTERLRVTENRGLCRDSCKQPNMDQQDGQDNTFVF